MPRGNKNLDEDKKLFEIVRKYICLYDKSHPDYNNKLFKQKCWGEIENVLGMDKDTAEKTFVNVKKRYSKLTNAHRRAVSSQKGVRKEEIKLKEYEFLAWLDPFIKLRNVLTDEDAPSFSHNFMQGHANEDHVHHTTEETSEIQDDDHICEEDQHVLESYPPISPSLVSTGEKTTSRIVDEATDHNKTLASLTCGKDYTQKTNEFKKNPVTDGGQRNHVNKLRPKLTRKMTGKEKLNKTQVSDVEEKILPTMGDSNYQFNNIKSVSQHDKEKDEDDLFGELIVKELKRLSRPLKCKFKHEVNNLLYRVQLEQLKGEETSNQSQS